MQTAAKVTEYMQQVLNATYEGYVKWGDDMLNGIVKQGGDLGKFSDQDDGIVKWIKEGSFTTKISDDWYMNIDAAAVKAASAAAVDRFYKEGAYLVNTTNGWTWAWDNYTESGLNLDKNDMYREYFGDEIWLVIWHTNDTGPNSAYHLTPGWSILDQLSLTATEVINSSAWSQSKIGFSDGWDLDLQQSYLEKGDVPPGGIWMTIPICQLGQMPAPADLSGRTCMNIKTAAEVNSIPGVCPSSGSQWLTHLILSAL